LGTRARLFVTPSPSYKKLDLDGRHQTPLLPPIATTISGNRKKFTSREIPAKTGNFRRRRRTSRNFRAFREAVEAGLGGRRCERHDPDAPRAVGDARSAGANQRRAGLARSVSVCPA
jgi:hypothetical protein